MGSSEHLRGFSVCSVCKYLADCISFFDLFTVVRLRQPSIVAYGLQCMRSVTTDFGLALMPACLVS